MSYYNRRSSARSNWKRPKAKIYDCNQRDIENFYTSNYTDYLSEKKDITDRALERERRGDAEQLSSRFEQRRAASLVYGEDDSPRTVRFIPNRQNTTEGTSSNEHSYHRSRVEQNGTSEMASDIRSTVSASRSVNFASSTTAEDSEMIGIEQRLEKLRKLREELGLPAEINTGSSSITSRTVTEASTRIRSPSETRIRTDARTRVSPMRLQPESSYSTKSESSSLRNGIDDIGSSYSKRAIRSQGIETNGLSSAFDSSNISTTRSRKRVEKPSLDGIDLNFDEDTFMASMRKKLPSSTEILDRIRNMDIE